MQSYLFLFSLILFQTIFIGESVADDEKSLTQISGCERILQSFNGSNTLPAVIKNSAMEVAVGNDVLKLRYSYNLDQLLVSKENYSSDIENWYEALIFELMTKRKSHKTRISPEMIINFLGSLTENERRLSFDLEMSDKIMKFFNADNSIFSLNIFKRFALNNFKLYLNPNRITHAPGEFTQKDGHFQFRYLSAVVILMIDHLSNENPPSKEVFENIYQYFEGQKGEQLALLERLYDKYGINYMIEDSQAIQTYRPKRENGWLPVIVSEVSTNIKKMFGQNDLRINIKKLHQEPWFDMTKLKEQFQKRDIDFTKEVEEILSVVVQNINIQDIYIPLSKDMFVHAVGSLNAIKQTLETLKEFDGKHLDAVVESVALRLLNRYELDPMGPISGFGKLEKIAAKKKYSITEYAELIKQFEAMGDMKFEPLVQLIRYVITNITEDSFLSFFMNAPHWNLRKNWTNHKMRADIREGKFEYDFQVIDIANRSSYYGRRAFFIRNFHHITARQWNKIKKRYWFKKLPLEIQKQAKLKSVILSKKKSYEFNDTTRSIDTEVQYRLVVERLKKLRLKSSFTLNTKLAEVLSYTKGYNEKQIRGILRHANAVVDNYNYGKENGRLVLMNFIQSCVQLDQKIRDSIIEEYDD